MKGIYLYPITARDHTGVSNPYIQRLAGALSNSFQVVNRNEPSNRGIMDIIKFLPSTDILYLNWIEDLPAKHMGYLQTLFFFLLRGYCRAAGKKIVWTLHNKQSHTGNHLFMKNLIFRFMKSRSDLVVTHAEEGLTILPRRTRKLYIPHPVTGDPFAGTAEGTGSVKQHDIIIWGTIAAYKGVDAFLRYLEMEGILDQYRILIAGKVVERGLEEFLENLAGKHPRLVLVNRFVPDRELAGMINGAGVTLFTYHASSVLSSGALMDSLHHDSVIMGPHTGAFVDLARENLIRTYRDYGDLVEQLVLLKKKDFMEPYRSELKRRFMKEHTWEMFNQKLAPHLNALFRINGRSSREARRSPS